jgi:hypothetical protein
MRCKARLLAACLILAAAPSAFAESFTVSIDSLTFAQGQTTGTLNVMISNTSAVPLGLTEFGFAFQITPVNSAPPELGFVDPQPQPFSSSDYVFSGNSLDNTFNSPLGNVSKANTPADTYIGGDATYDGSDVAISSTTGSLLLPQLQVTLSPQFLQSAGTFNISLVAGSNGESPTSPNSDTFFASNDPNSPTGLDNQSFTTNVGTVTIPGVVPEPSSIVLLAAGGLSTLLACLVHRYKNLDTHQVSAKLPT